MRKILAWYRGTSIIGRLITAAFILGILAAGCYNFGWPLIPVIVGGVTTMFLLEVGLMRPNLIAATVMTLFAATFIAVYVYNIIKGMGEYKTANELALIEGMTYAGTLTSFILILAGSWYIANGRFLVNVAMSYLLFAVTVILLLIATVNPLYITFIAVIPALIWIALRRYVLYRRFRPESMEVIPRRKADNNAQKRIEKDMNVKESSMSEGIIIAEDGKHIYLVYPITPQKSVEFTSRGVYMDGLDISMSMENLTNKIISLSKTAKVNHKKFVPIIYVTNSLMNRALTPVNFRNRQKPDVVAGTVFFCNGKMLKRLQMQVNAQLKPLTSEELTNFQTLR